MIRVLIADDHKLFREGLKSLLDREEGIEVVGETGDGRTSVQRARDLSPDVIIMDIGMPDLNGIEATRRVLEVVPEVKVVALSMHTGSRMVTEMLRAGAVGYISKLGAFEEVIRAVYAVSKGERYLSPSVTGVIVDEIVKKESSKGDSVFTVLSPREREVLQMVAEGCHTKEIAATLSISTRTVEVHRRNVMDKLGLDTVADLTRYAIREGLVQLDD